MPRSLDPARAALLNKPKGLGLGPRVSISVDDITAQTSWQQQRTTSTVGGGGLLYPLPSFYLQPPSPNGSARAVKLSTVTTPNVVLSPPQADEPHLRHRGELDMAEKYNYDLARAQLKASSRTSALLAGFAMVALVELQYDEDTPRPVLILLGVVTSLLVSVHLLALMMSTCILPYMEATGCTQDSPHIKLKFYIDLSWIFSTCIGLLLFLFEIGIIFIVKFFAVHFQVAAYVTTAMLVPVVIVFIVFSYLIHKNRVSHSFDRINMKIGQLHDQLTAEAGLGVKKPPTVQDI